MLKQQDIKRCFCFNFIYQIYYMHIKEAIQRRINQQKQPSSSSPLKKSNLIGSIHTGRIDYYPDQPFFSDFKVRKQVKQAKDYVKTFKDGDILQLRQKPWNASVLAPSKFNDFQKEESQRSKLLKIKLGFSDFTPIKYHPNKIYEGVQTRDGFKGWNVSTYFERQQKKQGEQLSTINAIENSIKYNQSNLTNYKSLGKRYNQTVSLQKDQMQKNTKIISDLTQSFMFSYPNASPEKTNASVFKMFDSLKRQKMKNSLMLSQETQDSFTTSFKAKLSPTQKSKIKCVYFHTGAWQKCSQKRNIDTKDDSDIQNMNDKEQDDKCWSCCMNSEKQSKGCSYRIEDGNRMNLQSFNA